MAPTLLSKKPKKAAEKPSLKAKDKTVDLSTPSSSSKPTKALKRKINADEDEPPTLEPAKGSKKSKNISMKILKTSKLADNSSNESEPDTPVKKITMADKAKTASKPATEEKAGKSNNKLKNVAPPSTSKESNKKSLKVDLDLPTFISRPRKQEPISSKTKSKKAKVPTPELEASDEDEQGQAEEVEEESGEETEEVHLHGFSTDEDSSDEDDAMDDEPSEFDMGKLPTIAKDDETVKRKLEKAKRQPTEDRGVLYLGRLPHGFYEEQLKAYFSQFGNVTRLRVSRNKKTGKSKHYGFIEFDSSAVAQIVAETMDNYLIMNHIMRCKLIPKDQVHPELWVGANRKWRVVPQERVTQVKHNKARTEEEQKRAAKRLLKRQQLRKRKLEESGIKYDFDAASYKRPKQVEA